ncbi:hypothetical protein [Kutzneria kofuensis]|uniref:hypothetical protein n=1 Tax=Kutzneria kofuensis TaxID=103725 RepID=UPI003CD0B228
MTTTDPVAPGIAATTASGSTVSTNSQLRPAGNAFSPGVPGLRCRRIDTMSSLTPSIASTSSDSSATTWSAAA